MMVTFFAMFSCVKSSFISSFLSFRGDALYLMVLEPDRTSRPLAIIIRGLYLEKVVDYLRNLAERIAYLAFISCGRRAIVRLDTSIPSGIRLLLVSVSGWIYYILRMFVCFDFYYANNLFKDSLF